MGQLGERAYPLSTLHYGSSGIANKPGAYVLLPT